MNPEYWTLEQLEKDWHTIAEVKAVNARPELFGIMETKEIHSKLKDIQHIYGDWAKIWPPRCDWPRN